MTLLSHANRLRGPGRLLQVSSLLLLAACTEPPEPPEPIQSDEAAPGYVGSSACASCHERAFEDWRQSHHYLAMQAPEPEYVRGAFDGSTLDYFDERATFQTKDGRFRVRIEAGERPAEDHDVAYTFGGFPLQQYLVDADGGRLQALPYAWDSRPADAGGQRWFHLYADERIAPGDALHWQGRNLNWNYMCAECHSTNLRMNYALDSDSFDTRYDEVTVGCEACHGPASRHLAQADAGAFDAQAGLSVDLDDVGDARWLPNAETGIANRSRPADDRAQPDGCGLCHSLRASLADREDHDAPLSHSHRVSLLDEHRYFADGQIQDEVYVYGSFLQSRMYAAGVTCSDCHDPHTARLRTGPEPNDVCSLCHQPEVFRVRAHSGHAPADAGCVDCHMTERIYMTVDGRRDHSFRVPRPDVSASTGSPDACLGCHGERDSEWSLGAYKQLYDSSRFDVPHYGSVLHKARRGHANSEIAALVMDSDTPAIVSATALTLMRPPLRSEDLETLTAMLAADDDLVRRAALEAASIAAADERIGLAGPLLDDPALSVRIEAVNALAELADLLSYDDRRRFVAAEAEYRAVLSRTLNRPESMLALGVLDQKLGKLNDAEAWFARAFDADADFSAARINLADLKRQLGEDDAVGRLLADGIEARPQDPALRYAYAMHLVRSGSGSSALVELESAVRLAPDNPDYVYALGVALNSLGQPDEAVATLADARSRFPNHYEIGWAQATMLRDRARFREALQIARELSTQYPEDTALQRLIAALESRVSP